MIKFFFLTTGWLIAMAGKSQTDKTYKQDGRSILFTNARNERLRITPYGDFMVRIQTAKANEHFFADSRYEMVESHQWPGGLQVTDRTNYYQLGTGVKNSLQIHLDKKTYFLSYYKGNKSLAFLAQEKETAWESDSIHSYFKFDSQEHFTGLGHGYFGRVSKLDLRGEVITRNYGSEHGQQAPLLVPFYISSKGYGVFLNSTFPNTFNFGKDGRYEFSIAGEGQMDYFVILGPTMSDILNRYTQLTGRPRLPPKAVFGLALSDKGHDYTSTTPSDENWWKQKISAHRQAGYPLDHIVNDNRWRAGGGERCKSFFEWDKTRYPDPKEYEKWVQSNGLYLTLDFNRCIAAKSDGWKKSFNIPKSDSIDFNESAPDFTNKEVRQWFWSLTWNKSLNPALAYPGDALWIDEFDEMGKAPPTIELFNGSKWQEMKNYWFFLIAKSLVQEGWDKQFKGTKRPFVWIRGGTAGAQRYASLWSGDIQPTYEEMKSQIRGLLLAGISGFPFWGHDAGGFYDWENSKGPNDTLYRQWGMAFGSFTPFWKPHGPGQSRWPLDRSVDAQKDAKTFSTLRYELMPYLYTYAHDCTATGMPIARAMMVDYPADSVAWQSDLQYMWGNELLVAPNCSIQDNVKLWLPAGRWFDFWSDSVLLGNQILNYPAPTGKLPLFVKAGAIIPMANFALSTAFIQSDSLTLHVYAGKDGKFVLYEDDGISEAYKEKKERRTTSITFHQPSFALTINTAIGNYAGGKNKRAYKIVFHGLDSPICLQMNGTPINADWDSSKNLLYLQTEKIPVVQKIVMQKIPCK